MVLWSPAFSFSSWPSGFVALWSPILILCFRGLTVLWSPCVILCFLDSGLVGLWSSSLILCFHGQWSRGLALYQPYSMFSWLSGLTVLWPPSLSSISWPSGVMVLWSPSFIHVPWPSGLAWVVVSVPYSMFSWPSGRVVQRSYHFTLPVRFAFDSPASGTSAQPRLVSLRF